MSDIPAIPPGTSSDNLIAALNDRIRRINLALGEAGSSTTITRTIIKTGGGVAAAGDVNYGTHAQRLAAPAGAFADGAVWYETDRTAWYQLEAGGVSAGSWRWIDGAYACAQAALPTDLGPDDAGLLANVTDYNHTLRWNGGAWTAGPGWDEPCYIRGFMVDPAGSGWKLCDGNGDDGSAIGVAHPVKYLKPDGTLGSITSATVAPCVPNLVGSPAFLQFGAAGGTTAAVAPTLTMNSYTPAGTVSQPTFSGTALAAHFHLEYLGNDGVNNALDLNLSGLVTGSLANCNRRLPLTNITAQTDGFTLQTQTASAGTPAGTVSQPTFTGTPATLTGAISTTGAPAGVTLRPWFRK